MCLTSISVFALFGLCLQVTEWSPLGKIAAYSTNNILFVDVEEPIDPGAPCRGFL